MNRIKAKRILIVNPFGIGDVLFTTPMVRGLREAYPDATLGYLCNRRVDELVRTNVHLDLIFIFEKDEYRTLWRRSKKECLRMFFRFLKEIRSQRFDVLMDLSLGWHYSFLGWLLGIPTRIGFNYRRRGRFLTKSKSFRDLRRNMWCNTMESFWVFWEFLPQRRLIWSSILPKKTVCGRGTF